VGKLALDLFCGSGAVTAGMKSAGFNVVGAVDVDPIASATYRSNHPEVHLVENDIRTVLPEEFFEVIKEKLDLLAVCAPCQPFSNRNRFRSNTDDRAGLILAALPFIKEYTPELVFFENVPGIGNRSVFSSLEKNLIRLGYHLSKPKSIDAADLGVPQKRQRMILIGARDEQILSRATVFPLKGRQTVFEAIGNLPVPPIGKSNVGVDLLHYARKHDSVTIQRLRHISHNGGSRNELPPALQLKCHQGLKKSSFPDSYGRLLWGAPAPTLTTGCTDLTKGRYAHPEQDRAITLREAARLQSFPDDYIFIGNASQIATQIGNAVPPKMMEEIAAVLFKALSNDCRPRN
jgi:DNA (cytosine-5)-methyltransferase 1